MGSLVHEPDRRDAAAAEPLWMVPSLTQLVPVDRQRSRYRRLMVPRLSNAAAAGDAVEPEPP